MAAAMFVMAFLFWVLSTLRHRNLTLQATSWTQVGVVVALAVVCIAVLARFHSVPVRVAGVAASLGMMYAGWRQR